MPTSLPYTSSLQAAIQNVIEKKELRHNDLFNNYLRHIEKAQHDAFIDELRSELLELLAHEDSGRRISSDYVNGFLTTHHYQRIYNSLIYLAMWRPLNHREDGHIICPISFDTIPANKLLTVSSGHRYNGDELTKCVNFNNPMTNQRFCQRDINRIGRWNSKTNTFKKVLSKVPSITVLSGCLAMGLFLGKIAIPTLLLIFVLPVLPNILLFLPSILLLTASVILIKYALTSLLNIIKNIKETLPPPGSKGPDEQAEESYDMENGSALTFFKRFGRPSPSISGLDSSDSAPACHSV